MFEREYRDLAHVPRWSILPTIQNQSVAEHSFYVALYASHILLKLNLDGKYLMPALRHAIEHDRDECYMSDIPGPAKRGCIDPDKSYIYKTKENLRRFESNDFSDDKIAVAVRKVADLMDEYAFWKEEGILGNGRAGQMLKVIEERLRAAGLKLGKLTGNEDEVVHRVLHPFMAGCNVNKIVPEDNQNDVAS